MAFAAIGVGKVGLCGSPSGSVESPDSRRSAADAVFLRRLRGCTTCAVNVFFLSFSPDHTPTLSKARKKKRGK